MAEKEPPDSKDVIRHLVEVEKRGPVRTNDNTHTGVHGTSEERVKELINSGLLKSSPLDTPIHATDGSTAIFPTGRLAARAIEIEADQAADDLIKSPEKGRDYAEKWAKDNAQTDALLRGVGLGEELDKYESLHHANGLLAHLKDPDQDARKEHSDYFINHRGIDSKRLGKNVGRALHREGFLLGVDTDNLPRSDQAEIYRDDPGNSNLLVRTQRRGIDYRAVTGNEPLGKDEKKSMNKMKNRLTGK